jgi:hypothetical protein
MRFLDRLMDFMEVVILLILALSSICLFFSVYPMSDTVMAWVIGIALSLIVIAVGVSKLYDKCYKKVNDGYWSTTSH